MKITRYIKVVILTLFFLSLSYLNYYPTTGAKYIDTKKALAKYYLNIKKMYYGKNNESFTILDTSTYAKANFSMIFNRSDLFTSNDTKDIYTIKVDSGCTITSVTGGTIYKKTLSSNQATIEYKTVSSDAVTVKYSCPVSSITSEENISTRFDVYERITPEQTTQHAYLYGKISMTLEEYYAKYPLPTGTISSDKKTYILPAAATNKYNNFKSWINDYTSQRITDGLMLETDVTTFKNYIYSVFSDETNILNTANTLKGFNISYDETLENYTYVIDDSCLGYALTKDSMDAKVEVSPASTYYISDKTNVKNIFFDYIEMYKDKLGYTDEDIANIKAYVNSKNGDLSLVKGITCTETDSYIKISNTSSLTTYANTYVIGYVSIEFDGPSNMANAFITLVNDQYSDIVSDISTYSNYSNMKTSVRINYKTSSHESNASIYTNTFIGYDPTYKWWNLITISSDGTKTYASVEKLSSASTLPAISNISNYISFALANDTNTKTSATTIINDLDTIYSAKDSTYVKYITDLTDNFFDPSNYTGSSTITSYTNGKIISNYNTSTSSYTFTLSK